MNQKPKEIVIEKEDAVFRLDGNGCWRNQHGKFQHKKVIDYFHASIEKDHRGFYVSQMRDDIFEKVYFPYEETALFVFDVIIDDDIVLLLNTKKKLQLDPARLSLKEDSLYVTDGEDLIKFTDRSLMKIVPFIETEAGQYVFVYNDKRYPIEKPASQ